MLTAFVDTAKLCSKLWDAFIMIVHVKKLVHLSLRKKHIEALKRELDELRKQYTIAKDYDVNEMFECVRCKMYKTDKIVEKHLLQSFTFKMPLREEKLLDNIRHGRLFR